jgi:hypothetical protein
VAVRETADGAHRPSQVRTPTVGTVHTDHPRDGRRSAIRPWTPQHAGLRRYEMTHPGTSKTARLARDIAANGPFSLVVVGDGFEPT